MSEEAVQALRDAGLAAFNRPSEKCPECGWQMRHADPDSPDDGRWICDIDHLMVVTS